MILGALIVGVVLFTGGCSQPRAGGGGGGGAYRPGSVEQGMNDLHQYGEGNHGGGTGYHGGDNGPADNGFGWFAVGALILTGRRRRAVVSA
jgi:hypothetical protein